MALTDEEQMDPVKVTIAALRGYDAMADRDDHAAYWFLHPDVARGLVARVEAAERVLRDLVDPDECGYDHHGYCQAHNWLTEGTCPQARAKLHLRLPYAMTGEQK